MAVGRLQMLARQVRAGPLRPQSATLLSASACAAAPRFENSRASSSTSNRGSTVGSLSQEPSKTEADIDSIAYGFMGSQALFAALETGLFDLIAESSNGLTYEELQQRQGKSPRLQTLLTALTSLRLLHKDGDKYVLPKNVAQFMVRGARHFYGDYLQYQIGRQFYPRMGSLSQVMTTGEAPDYSKWFSDPSEAQNYTVAQHNGSMATARALAKVVDITEAGGVKRVLDVGGGSGAFDVVFCQKNPAMTAVVLELPEVAKTGATIVGEQFPDLASRIAFIGNSALDSWPVEGPFDMVLMSYISGSVPKSYLNAMYSQAFAKLRQGGKLVVHDFMVNDTLDGPPLAALWALQHVTVNAEGAGLCPKLVADEMVGAGFVQENTKSMEMIGGMTKVVVATKH